MTEDGEGEEFCAEKARKGPQRHFPPDYQERVYNGVFRGSLVNHEDSYHLQSHLLGELATLKPWREENVVTGLTLKSTLNYQ